MLLIINGTIFDVLDLIIHLSINSAEFIDKWIIKSKTSKIVPFIINNKTDIESSLEYDERLGIYKNIGLKIISISAKYDENIGEIVDYLKDKCVLFVGNSGAGKSTLTSVSYTHLTLPTTR